MFVPQVSDFVPTISVVRDDFCFPYLVNLAMKTNTGFFGKHIDVIDDNGAMLLQVDGRIWEFNKRRIICDPMGIPIITMCREAISWHQRWAVYSGGENIDGSNLLYTVKKSNPVQLKPHLQVFLASNPARETCDFRVVGSYVSLSFKVYKGDAVVAEVKEKSKLGRVNKGMFEARIYPGVDYAFIVSLLVMVDELHS